MKKNMAAWILGAGLFLALSLTSFAAGSSLFIEGSSSSDETVIGVTYTAADGTEYEDTMYLYTSDIDDPQEEMPDPDPAPAAEEEDTGAVIPFWFMPAALVIAVLLLLMVLLILRRKRAARQENRGEEGAEAQGDGAEPGEFSPAQDHPEHSQDPQAQKEPEEELPEDCHAVYLCAVGCEDIVHRIVLEEGKETTLGRSSRADFVLDPQDRKLSGKHCRMIWEEGKLYVIDENSLYGTFVNGDPIQSMGRICLGEGETIRMGSCEYRVSLQHLPDSGIKESL